MSANPNGHPMASVAVFCPQSKAPGESYLNEVHSFLRHSEYLEPFVQRMLDLKDVWTILANERQDIADLGQGPRYIQNLSEWFATGKSSQIANCMSGILSLPLLVVIQICQYFQYLELHGMSHSQFMAQLRTGGGIQGYCGGLLPAIAIACSKTEAEVVENAARAARIALAIGAYGELGDDESVPGATTIVVRTKRVGQGDELIRKFPGSYISAVTDPKTISIVGPVPVLLKLQSYAREQGLLVQEMFIRGKVHNPENFELAYELCQLCDRTEILRLPDASNLQACVRSNKTGDLITRGSLTHETVNVILASRCEWYTLLTELAKDLDLSGRRSHTFATFGIGDCIPLSPFHKLQLQITKVDVQSLIAETMHKVRTNRLEDGYSYPTDAIAITGASCRLPGANSMEELWDLISSGNSQHTEVPTDRFDLHGSFRASQDRKFTDKRKFYGNFVDQVENFDHTFFRTNPKEALNMDPQQRVLLELAYQAIESSGYLGSHRRESGDSVGCFIGASFAEYLDNTNAHPPTAYTSTGTIRAFLCGRISYYFGWSGPSEVLDTACSSSLVAINRACKAIQIGECTMALAGGVNIMSGINNFLDLAKAGFLSPTGQCKPFDQAADGYCRSEGGGMVVLKLLNQALADGDQILGVIPGIATNQGGLSSSITIPHSPAQKKLYQTVLRQAGMKPDQVSYVEAHGTGTQAGDPLEIASIREVFGGQDRTDLLNVGSLKGNIGHAETAAGVASLLKILAMINKASIPPQASHKSLNPKIPDLGVDKMSIASKLTRWDADLLAACVNSYGAAGSNCAMICCEGPPQKTEVSKQFTTAEAESTYPLIVSAASQESLYANIENLGKYLQKITPKPNLGDVAFTLSKRRKLHRQIFVTCTSDINDLVQSLKKEAQISFEVPQTPKRVVLAFGGQTKRTVNMEKSLYESHPRLKDYVDECDKIVTDLGFPTLLPSIFQSEPLTDVVTLQCGTFAMQYACAKCWIDAGLQVEAIIGHSFGELTAMVVSGVLSLRDGLKLIASRASLMVTKWGPDRGTMLVIHSSRDTVQGVITTINAGSTEPELEFACYNAPSVQVVVGSSLAIDRTESLLNADPRFSGIRSQRLDVTHGFHSKFTQGILDDLDQVSISLTYSKPEIHLETCTAEPSNHISAPRPSQHAREPVHFSDAVRRIEERLGPCIWLEAGMDSPIIPMIKRALTAPDDHSLQAIKMSDSQAPMKMLSNVTMNFWREGIPVLYWNFLPSRRNAFKQIWLPPYQFQPTAHWLKNIDRAVEAQKNAVVEKTPTVEKIQEPEAPLRLVNVAKGASKNERSREFDICMGTKRFTKIVSGHAVRQRPLCPASMYMECAAMGVQLLQGFTEAGTLSFLDVSFQAALGVDLAREASLTLEKSNDSQAWNFVIKSSSTRDSKSKCSTHAKGRIVLTPQPDFRTYERLIADRIYELESKPNTEKLMSNRAYGLFSQVVHYADFLHGISHITLDKAEAIANIDLPDEAQFGLDESTVTQYCDTIAIDTFIQVVGLLINSSALVTSEDVFVATGVERVSMSSACDFHNRKSWTVYTKYTSTGEGQAAGDVFVMTREGALAMIITGAQFTKLLISKLERFLDSANAKPSQGTAVGKKCLPHGPVKSPVTSSTATSVEGTETPTDIDNSSTATSVESNDGLVTPEAVDDGAEMSLRKIIATYTGLSPAEIAHDASMADLGVDSLAAVELAEELQAQFGKEVVAEDLLESSYGTLSELLVPFSSTKKAILHPSDDSGPQAAIPIQFSTSPSSSSNVNASPQNAQGHQVALKLLSDTSGAPIASINGKATLQELGIDSLSAVELKGDLEDAFEIEIEDDRFTLDSTVKDILDFLGVGRAPQEASSSLAAVTKPTNQVGRDESSGFDKSFSAVKSQGKVVELGSPMEALVQCESFFDKAAAKCGFLNYWTEVAPKQDELLLAYICEAFQALGSDIGQIPQGQQVPSITHRPKHKKVMNRLLGILKKHDVLTREGLDLIRGSRRIPSAPSQELHNQFLAQFPPYAGEARLMALTGTKLADCLAGKTDPITLMFRGAAAQKIMEDYYCASPMLSTLTEQLVTFLRTVVTSSSTASSDTPIRILEVGAGFGGTTTRLAEVLQSSRVPVSYKFTDISPSLVKGAKAKFARYPWMEFQSLNLESDMPASLKDTFDIVIGTNCVHATTNKTKTISRLKSLLNAQGFVVLSEVTQLVDWYDIVFGLLDGWWLANDGSTYPLQPPESWVRSFEQAGFSRISFSQGASPESNTQRLLVASNDQKVTAPLRGEERQPSVQTVVYKEVEDTQIEADIYLPAQASAKAMPVALMIHGGGHMTLSRKAIRPFQTACLLRHNVLPVSIDYRLCPEINLIDGPITDVRDAYGWLQTGLQAVVRSRGILVDEKRIVVIGWSTGGHLAMTTAWKSKEAGLRPPVAILSFYGPTDFESGGKLIDLNILSLFCFALSNYAFLPPPSPSLQQSVAPLTPSFRPPQISMSGGPKCTRSGGCQWTTSSPLCLRNQ
ncbi:hypothetical protein HO133_000216 [Letharia lupina]|uniref:Polyketide synthase n=1 Tax=Letharia lupina TaxID=560253 RepID=A0A8H6CHL6_9LECA|nr:uncharacterized protein HO133_000216 [Letharia lupina]KAF6223374.1 hypothetical protein HO133_000216 [Letharia lupina]